MQMWDGRRKNGHLALPSALFHPVYHSSYQSQILDLLTSWSYWPVYWPWIDGAEKNQDSTTFPSSLEHLEHNKISSSAQMLNLIHWLVAQKRLLLSACLDTIVISMHSMDVPSASVSPLTQGDTIQQVYTMVSWEACLERQWSGVRMALNNT